MPVNECMSLYFIIYIRITEDADNPFSFTKFVKTKKTKKHNKVLTPHTYTHTHSLTHTHTYFIFNFTVSPSVYTQWVFP